MLRAAALLYALAVALLIGLVTTGILMYSAWHMQAWQSISLGHKALRNVESGLQLQLAEGALSGEQSQRTIDLFGDGKDTVQLQKKPWGAYSVLTALTKEQGTTVCKTALAGIPIPTGKRYGLWLAGANRPLKVCGNTVIRGNAKLPKAGVERAYIEGQTYAGDQLVYGHVSSSERFLPELNPTLVHHNQAYLRGHFSPSDSIVQFSDVEEGIRFRDFKDATVIAHHSGHINLAGKHYSGNIIFHSGSGIFIGADSKLDRVICYAPEIEIESGFAGSIQAFASLKITCGENVLLSYPSVLCTFHHHKQNNEYSVKAGQHSRIEGLVVAWQSFLSPRYPPSVYLAENTEVTGQVYVRGNTELKGNVKGSVYTRGFTLRTPSAVYENHLLNASIDGNALSEYFAGCNLINGENKTLTVIDWL